MKAPVTFFIGVAVLVLGTIQFVLSYDPIRIISIAIGLFFMVFGSVVGWTRSKRFTLLLGHAAIVIGCLVTAWAIYQLPFLKTAPSLLEVFDLPLFWGLFTTGGGYCMITHASCACCIRQHEERNRLR